MIYAQHAVWPMKDGQHRPDPAPVAGSARARRGTQPAALDKIRSPLYEAKADPDIYFFGFDLTVAEAEGGTGEHPG